MIDPELKEHLVSIEAAIVAMRKDNKGPGWHFLLGIMYGLGYITGAVILIVGVTWILNVLGLFPAFNHIAGDFKNAVQSVNTSSLH